MNEHIARKVTRARAGLVLDQPFFGLLALRLTLKEDASARACWTDGVTLGYNPDFIGQRTLDEAKGALAEATLHFALAHPARRQDRETRRWNDACDRAIRAPLEDSGFFIPAGYPARWPTDAAAETIFSALPADPPDDGGQGQGQGQGGLVEVRDAPGADGGKATESEMRQAEAEAKIAVGQAAAAAKAYGQFPAGLARFVAQALKAHVPWREVLRRFIDEAARNDYSWRRPNPRYLASGLYLPSLYNREMRPLAVAVDTSGSIMQSDLDQFAAELTAINEDLRVGATIICCDADVQAVAEVGPDEPVMIDPRGGGGTDFRPPFAEVERRGLVPSCMIYLTDGECSSFPPEPPYPVLWAILGGCDFRPPFGEVMEVRP